MQTLLADERKFLNFFANVTFIMCVRVFLGYVWSYFKFVVSLKTLFISTVIIIIILITRNLLSGKSIRNKSTNCFSIIRKSRPKTCCCLRVFFCIILNSLKLFGINLFWFFSTVSKARFQIRCRFIQEINFYIWNLYTIK